MSDQLEPLILDLLEFVAAEPRRYEEVMEAWRTSCPRLPVWEDAKDRGLVVCQPEGNGTVVTLTDSGRALLKRHRQ